MSLLEALVERVSLRDDVHFTQEILGRNSCMCITSTIIAAGSKIVAAATRKPPDSRVPRYIIFHSLFHLKCNSGLKSTSTKFRDQV